MNQEKAQIMVISTVIIFSFVLGRYSVQFNKQLNTTKSSDTEIHKRTETTTTETPKGDKKTVTVITEDSETKQKSDTIKQSVVPNPSLYTLSALITPGIGRQPYYGASIQRKVLGPVSLGVFGLNNGNVGISLGVSF